MKELEHRNRIRNAVTKYLDENSQLVPFDIMIDDESRNHIIDIGTSIMCTKWKIGYPGGGFVQAVIDNNLTEAFSRADEICSRALKFFVTLKYNLGYIN